MLSDKRIIHLQCSTPRLFALILQKLLEVSAEQQRYFKAMKVLS